MSTISDRLKELGVKVGARDLSIPRKSEPTSLDDLLGGQEYPTHYGATYLVEKYYSSYINQNQTAFQLNHSLASIGAWANDERIEGLSPDKIAFLDTETTGLSGGTGTYAFLIGVGRIEKDRFHLAQFFMRDPNEEAAQMAALEAFLGPCRGLVTFNGKTFDLPLLNSRFISQGWVSPFKELSHIDLLHLARRLWRARLASCTLTSLEYNILGAIRTMEDVPGWMIPQLYFDYLRSGDAQPLTNVFYHNAMDVISMAALLSHISKILSDPLNAPVSSPIDKVSMAKHYEDLGDWELSANLYARSLEDELPEDLLLDALVRLALLFKRQGDYLDALPLWERAAKLKCIPAFIELAKYYEHQQRDYQTAMEWTESAINIANEAGDQSYEGQFWMLELKHRLNRLQRKNNE